MIQGTPEWFEARRGKITGTGFSKVLSKRGNARLDYMRGILLERKTGKNVTDETFTNEAMEWGKATEPQARKYYELYTGNKVTEVGFIQHPQELFNKWVGVSPDGLVEPSGGIEIKCPDTSTHLETIRKDKLPSKYVAQVQGNMWVTGKEWWDFISFDPRVEKEPFWMIKVNRDEDYIKKLAQACDEFIQELVVMEITSTTGIDPAILLDKTAPSEEEWEQRKREIDEGLQKIVEGKIRHGVVCALIQAGKKVNKKTVNKFVDFIVTGE